MGKIKNPGKVIGFFILLIVRVALVFSFIGLIGWGVWALLHLLLT